MKKIVIIFYVLSVVLAMTLSSFIVLLITGFYITDDSYRNDVSHEFIQEHDKKAEIKNLEIEVLNNRAADEIVFSFSLDDFIESYNGFYWKDRKRIYLTPAEKWQISEFDISVHSTHKTLYYYFKENYNNWVLPSITAYVPENADYVQEITVDFDDHSYSEEMYKLYEEMCFYTIKVFFNELSDQKITELYKTINKLAYDNVFPHEKRYAHNAVPYALYYKDGIGLYPYFAIGQSVRLCIIPVTKQTLDEFEKKGVKIYEISEN